MKNKFKRRLRIGLKFYTYYTTERKKSFAQERIKRLRAKGYSAIMVEREDHGGKFYRIYKRKR